MSRPGPHPAPAGDLDAKVPLLREAAGPWVRFHPSRLRSLHFSRSATSRFSDPDGEFGVLYAAETFGGAFIETFGRNLDVRSVTVTSLMSTGATQIAAKRPLRLIDLASSGGLGRLGADARLSSGDFGPSQTWSRALWLHPAHADGLYYRLRHDPSQCGVALFDRARSALTTKAMGTVWDDRHRGALVAALDTYAIGLIAE